MVATPIEPCCPTPHLLKAGFVTELAAYFGANLYQIALVLKMMLIVEKLKIITPCELPHVNQFRLMGIAELAAVFPVNVERE